MKKKNIYFRIKNHEKTEEKKIHKNYPQNQVKQINLSLNHK